MKALKLTILTMFIALGSAHAQNEQYATKVKELLQVSGSVNTFSVAVEQMVQQVRSMQPDVPAKFWDESVAEIKSTALDDLAKLLTPIYANHLTEADLDGLITFYKSDLGRKFAEKTPLITQESMVAGQQWGMEVGQRIADRLEEAGYN